jgi:hypothetical protein
MHGQQNIKIFVKELTGEANLSGCFKQYVVTDHTADFSAFCEWVTAGSVRLGTADPGWYPHIRLFPGDTENSFCEQSAFSAATDTALEENLRIF